MEMTMRERLEIYCGSDFPYVCTGEKTAQGVSLGKVLKRARENAPPVTVIYRV